MPWSQAVMEFIPTEESEHPDVVEFLVGEGNKAKPFFLHKTCLKLSSASFRNLLLQPQKRYNLPEIKPSTFEEIIKHMYTFSKWEFNGNLVDACCLLKSALDNDLEELAHSIITNLSELPLEEVGLTSGTACFVYDVLRNTSRLDEGKLKDVILSYICRNAKLILSLDSFLNLSLDGLLEILGNDHLQVNSELDVFKAVVSWGMHTLTKLGKSLSPQNMQDVLRQPLQVVRFFCLNQFESEYYVQRMGFTPGNQGIFPNDDEVDAGIEIIPVQPPGILSDKRAGSIDARAEAPWKFSNSESVRVCGDNLEPTIEDILRAELYVSNYKFQVETSLLKSTLSEYKDETRRALLTSEESTRKQVGKLESEIVALRVIANKMHDDFKILRGKIEAQEKTKRDTDECKKLADRRNPILHLLPPVPVSQGFSELIKKRDNPATSRSQTGALSNGPKKWKKEEKKETYSHQSLSRKWGTEMDSGSELEYELDYLHS